MLIANHSVPSPPAPRSVRRPDLTPKEVEVLLFIAEGLQNKEIAQRLGISHKTVEFHKTRLYEKIGVTGTVGAVKYALRNGYIT